MDRAPQAVVIIGAGQAGLSLAATLRAEGFGGRITLIGEEPDAPYQRPPLSKKYLLGEMSAERLALKSPEFYTDQGISLITGRQVTGIDRTARHVLLEGNRIAFDRLALTTGAVPRRLPAAIGGDLYGVHVIRNRADVDAMAPGVVAGRRVLIVGGGYIGLEAAAVCAARGMAVTLIEMAPRILNRVACAQTAAAVRALHLSHGVEIREGVGLVRLVGTDAVSGAELSDGTALPADLVIAGIGVTPATALAEAAGLTLDNGIAVDAQCRTSDPAILAAGDCASFPREGPDGAPGRIRLESVQNAIDQGTHAARAMLGSEAPYRPCPWFWSDQFDARLQIAGLGTGHDRIVPRPGSRPGGQSFWYFRAGRLLAVDAITDPKAYMQGKRWLEAGQSPDADLLADPARSLTEAIPA